MIVSSYFLLFTFSFLFKIVSSGSNKESQEFLTENSRKTDVVTLPSGLQYKIIESGKGTHHPTLESPCLCHYKGTLIDGSVFDSSYYRGEPSEFAPYYVVKGWTEALQLMVEGDKWELYVPSKLAYGDIGSPPKIKSGDALIFILELQKILGDKVPSNVCDINTFEGCNDQEIDYIKKTKENFGGDPDFLEPEIEYIKRVIIENPNRSPSNYEWGSKRIRILEKQLEQAKRKNGDL